jgi:hypothetical protein
MAPILPLRPCTIEHLKQLTMEFDHCRVTRSATICAKIFDRANCMQWTTLDAEYDYLDFIGRPVPEPSNMTFAALQYFEERS